MKKHYLIIAFIMLSVSVYSQTPQWRLLINSPVPDSLSLRYEDTYFTDANTGWIVQYSGKVFKTTDGGASWNNVLTSSLYPNGQFRSIGFFNSTSGILGTLDSAHVIYQTSNGGSNWIQYTPLPVPVTKGICGISIVNSDIAYACGTYESPARVIKTTNRGVTWSTVFSDSSLARSLVDCYFWSADSGIAVGGYNTNQYYFGKSVVIRTTDGGIHWQRTYISSRTGEWCWKISFVSGNTGYCSIETFGGFSYILKTTNNGSNWTEIPFRNYDQEGIGFVNENTGWLGGWTGPTYQTTNGGANWSLSGWGYYMNRFRFLSDTLAYAVGNRVYKYSRTPVGVRNSSFSIPTKFNLEQNYPNPFNPVTNIRFDIPSNLNGKFYQVKLSVFNALGETVQLLLNKRLNTGNYEVEFNGSRYPSGIYYYKLESENFSETKRMILLK